MPDSTTPPEKQRSEKPRPEHPEAIPTDSVFFNKVVPALLVILAVLTGAAIIIAAGILTGIIPWL
ncbi:MAG: hypothetical protein ACE5H9_13285 [Anaerolineae bacterium]